MLIRDDFLYWTAFGDTEFRYWHQEKTFLGQRPSVFETVGVWLTKKKVMRMCKKHCVKENASWK